MKARIKKTGKIKSFYPTTQSGYAGYVDSDGKFYYPNELAFRNEGVIKTLEGQVIETKEQAREFMIATIDKVIAGLQRNKEILTNGGRLENEHWTDIAGTFQNAREVFINQDKFEQ